MKTCCVEKKIRRIFHGNLEDVRQKFLWPSRINNDVKYQRTLSYGTKLELPRDVQWIYEDVLLGYRSIQTPGQLRPSQLRPLPIHTPQFRLLPIQTPIIQTPPYSAPPQSPSSNFYRFRPPPPRFRHSQPRLPDSDPHNSDRPNSDRPNSDPPDLDLPIPIQTP